MTLLAPNVSADSPHKTLSKITTFQKSILGFIYGKIYFFCETINVFRKIDYISKELKEILGQNYSYMKWPINGPFGTEHVKSPQKIIMSGQLFDDGWSRPALGRRKK